MEPQYTAAQVADRFVSLSQEDQNPLTHMKVQKLVYLAHGWMLGLGYGPLVQDAAEAWKYGPVFRMLYHRLKSYGGRHIVGPIEPEENKAVFSDESEAVIKAVWRHYGQISATTLSSMTHELGSPWEQTYRRGIGSQIIHDHIIRDYYAAIAARRPTRESV